MRGVFIILSTLILTISILLGACGSSTETAPTPIQMPTPAPNPTPTPEATPPTTSTPTLTPTPTPTPKSASVPMSTAPPTPVPTLPISPIPSTKPEAEIEPEVWVDPDIVVNIYDQEKAYNGTTLLRDYHNPEGPRIIEVDMQGRIIWKYLIPEDMGDVSDVEWLPESNNILFVSRQTGVYEINRQGRIVWSYETKKISHDADRLPNGNTIFVWGHPDTKDDAQVVEVNPEGEIVWEWYAKDYYPDMPPGEAGWTHTNAVTRKENGHTLISPRNFDFIVEFDPEGGEEGGVTKIGEGILVEQHDPEVLSNGNILIANQDSPHSAIEIEPSTGVIVWKFEIKDQSNWPIRDANRLPNGNTLITGSTRIIEVHENEVTHKNEIVWELALTKKLGPGLGGTGFYKAERICRND